MKWGQIQLLAWLPLAIPLAWAAFALLRRRRRALERLAAAAVLPELAPAWNPARARAQRTAPGAATSGMTMPSATRPARARPLGPVVPTITGGGCAGLCSSSTSRSST